MENYGDVTCDQELPVHPRSGTRAHYVGGCRHPMCVMANAAYQRHYRAGKRGTTAARMGGFKITRPIVDRRKRGAGRIPPALGQLRLPV